MEVQILNPSRNLDHAVSPKLVVCLLEIPFEAEASFCLWHIYAHPTSLLFAQYCCGTVDYSYASWMLSLTYLPSSSHVSTLACTHTHSHTRTYLACLTGAEPFELDVRSSNLLLIAELITYASTFFFFWHCMSQTKSHLILPNTRGAQALSKELPIITPWVIQEKILPIRWPREIVCTQGSDLQPGGCILSRPRILLPEPTLRLCMPASLCQKSS